MGNPVLGAGSCLSLRFSSFLFVVSSLKANLGIGFTSGFFFAVFSFTLGFKELMFEISVLRYPCCSVILCIKAFVIESDKDWAWHTYVPS